MEGLGRPAAVFALRKVDSLLNVGPIVHAAFGESAAGATEEPNPRVALAKRMARGRGDAGAPRSGWGRRQGLCAGKARQGVFTGWTHGRG